MNKFYFSKYIVSAAFLIFSFSFLISFAQDTIKIETIKSIKDIPSFSKPNDLHISNQRFAFNPLEIRSTGFDNYQTTSMINVKSFNYKYRSSQKISGMVIGAVIGGFIGYPIGYVVGEYNDNGSIISIPPHYIGILYEIFFIPGGAVIGYFIGRRIDKRDAKIITH